MRRSLLSLAALVCGIGSLFLPTLSSSAAPRAITPKASRTTVNRATLNQMNVAANIARAKRAAMSKRGGVVHFVQARNPNWSRSNLMTPAAAATTTLAMRRQGVSAHVHDMGSSGSFVHYGQVLWANKGATTNRSVANAATAKLKALGLQARVVTRVYKS
jgi:hypothetical protein